MEQLIIEASAKTPRIVFDPINNNFEISGESRPENVNAFFEPVFGWLDSYLTYLKSNGSKNDFTLRMYLEYFNSASAKYLLNLTKKLNEFRTAGIPIEVEWCYLEEDDDMKEAGEEIEHLSSIPFKYKAIN